MNCTQNLQSQNDKSLPLNPILPKALNELGTYSLKLYCRPIMLQTLYFHLRKLGVHNQRHYHTHLKF